ncbi:MAG: type VI-D CRISPR-associated RNA-guided ribonuclease Cas13d, partial [Planctomycetia bacterium]|nr:type VI-D CRISPR-associated RNA-guided ribonuclease Cas13d [Planctomycetia bacterium]
FLAKNVRFACVFDGRFSASRPVFYETSEVFQGRLHILFDLLDAKSEQEIIDKYYRFSIRKEGKNLGVNMKKIRELMIDACYPSIKDKIHDSYRKKAYAITDYILFSHLNDTDELDYMVAKLRETSDEEEKEELYQEFAQTAWDNVKDILEPFFKRFDGSFPAFTTDKIVESLSKEALIKKNCDIPFVQIIAFLCNFLEGKEINELLSAYIHKFESIQSFIDTLVELQNKQKVKFSDTYKIFNEFGGRAARNIAYQLRLLCSIGKMKPDLEGAKRPLYKAAIEMLGVPDDSKFVSDEWLNENLLLDSEASKEKKASTNPFRNFIANNVISSRRFQFLVRYTKPTAVQKLMSNKIIVRYVLTRLPEDQVKSYYKRYFSDKKLPAYADKMINELADKLTELSFEKVEGQRENIIASSKACDSDKNVEAERLKILIGLYLTVAYIAIKNLVKTNARYAIAYAAFDRDYEMFKKKDKKTVESFRIPYDYIDPKDNKEKTGYNKFPALTEYFLKLEDDNDYKPEPGQPFDKKACYAHLKKIRRHFTKKWREIFRQSMDEAKEMSSTGLLLTEVRNHAEHLNVLLVALPKYITEFRPKGSGPMRSYFELYHFLIQRLMCENSDLKIPTEYRREYVDSGIPCSDWIKIAYVSLGYNLPRYKNLTIEALFDKDSVSGKERESRKGQ